jgi:uncharacterized protein YkwD
MIHSSHSWEPNRDFDQRGPTLLRTARVSLLATIFISALLVPAASAAARSRARIDRVERGVVNILNAVRHHYGLGSLGVSHRMDAGASAHSVEMARTRVMTHGHWASRLPAYAGTSAVGEVVGWLSGAHGMHQAHLIVRNWMNSPPHRAVLLNGSYHRLGIGRGSSAGLTFFTVDVAR